MQIDAKPIDLRLTTPFRISRGVQDTSSNVVVQIQYNEHVGYGEAAPDEYYGENQETVLSCITTFADNLGDDPFLIEDIMSNLDHLIRFHPAAKAAVDMALYDLVGKILHVPRCISSWDLTQSIRRKLHLPWALIRLRIWRKKRSLLVTILFSR